MLGVHTTLAGWIETRDTSGKAGYTDEEEVLCRPKRI
jgi:hypothetical protein